MGRDTGWVSGVSKIGVSPSNERSGSGGGWSGSEEEGHGVSQRGEHCYVACTCRVMGAVCEKGIRVMWERDI